jgi:cellulose synthase/poly-beta-1,6-N-acetylglucosamine synthase-like glycosyltransferase
MIPGLARLDLPVMLGGTTNHFRVSALLDVGGWDAWNVTEDADLGLRLARCGFSVSDLPSQTLEEAPASLDAWMAQRTRWLKGWLQTTAVHLRNPRLALSTMGGFAYGSALAVCLGTVATALFGPLFFGLALFDLITGRLAPTEGFGGAITSSISLTLFGAGLLTVLGTAWVGMRRRGVAELAPWLLLMPAYLLLASVAAWRAVAEVIVAPQQWNKTQHGLARTSRAATVVNDHRQARRRRASMRGKTRYGT